MMYIRVYVYISPHPFSLMSKQARHADEKNKNSFLSLSRPTYRRPTPTLFSVQRRPYDTNDAQITPSRQNHPISIAPPNQRWGRGQKAVYNKIRAKGQQSPARTTRVITTKGGGQPAHKTKSSGPAHRGPPAAASGSLYRDRSSRQTPKRDSSVPRERARSPATPHLISLFSR